MEGCIEDSYAVPIGSQIIVIKAVEGWYEVGDTYITAKPTYDSDVKWLIAVEGKRYKYEQHRLKHFALALGSINHITGNRITHK